MWQVICRPLKSDTVVKNMAGVAVALVSVPVEDGFGRDEHEIARVAFARRNSKNPATPFDKALLEEIEKAMQAAAAMNDLDQEVEQARARADEALKAAEEQAVQAAKKRMRDVLGPPSRGTKPA